MDILPAAGIAAAGGYLLGSVPFSFLAVRLRTGTDLRGVGSGNVGATNAARVLGRRWFPLLFTLDAAKGAGAVLAAGLLAPEVPGRDWVRVAAALGAVLGHVFCLFLGFRGGKAVATGAGAAAMLSPWAAAAGAGVFLAVLLPWRFVSLGSVAAAVAACATEFALGAGRPVLERVPLLGFFAALMVVVAARHVPNLSRIAAGTEPRVSGRPPAPARGEEENP